MSIADLAKSACLAVFLCGCASGQGAGAGLDAPLRPLEEVRATRAIERALIAHGQSVAHGRHIRLVANRDVTCDAWIANTRHCVEYVTEADRARFGLSLPVRRTPGALVMAPGSGEDRGSDLLVLDAQDYTYEPDASRQGEGRPTLQEIEDRLERSVVDYLGWLRDNGRM